MANDQSFEIPQQLRELAEKNVEQASAAYGQFMNAMTQAMDMWWSALPPNEMTSGFKAVQDRAVRFAKQNADAGFMLASSLANAKDIQDVLALQSHYAQSQMHTYALQAQELGRLMTDAMKNRILEARDCASRFLASAQPHSRHFPIIAEHALELGDLLGRYRGLTLREQGDQDCFDLALAQGSYLAERYRRPAFDKAKETRAFAAPHEE